MKLGLVPATTISVPLLVCLPAHLLWFVLVAHLHTIGIIVLIQCMSSELHWTEIAAMMEARTHRCL